MPVSARKRNKALPLFAREAPHDVYLPAATIALPIAAPVYHEAYIAPPTKSFSGIVVALSTAALHWRREFLGKYRY